MRFLRFAAIAALGFSLAGCSLVFKLPTRQGNVIEQKQLDQLKVGMTREQVTYLMGTPIAASPFRSDRWDYIGYYKSPRGKTSTRTVTLFFDQNILARMEGAAPLSTAAVDEASTQKAPDAAAIFKQQKKEQNENERAEESTESGVILTQPTDNKP